MQLLVFACSQTGTAWCQYKLNETLVRPTSMVISRLCRSDKTRSTIIIISSSSSRETTSVCVREHLMEQHWWLRTKFPSSQIRLSHRPSPYNECQPKKNVAQPSVYKPGWEDFASCYSYFLRNFCVFLYSSNFVKNRALSHTPEVVNVFTLVFFIACLCAPNVRWRRQSRCHTTRRKVFALAFPLWLRGERLLLLVLAFDVLEEVCCSGAELGAPKQSMRWVFGVYLMSENKRWVHKTDDTYNTTILCEHNLRCFLNTGTECQLDWVRYWRS